jgi:flagellar biosynthesis protein FliP
MKENTNQMTNSESTDGVSNSTIREFDSNNIANGAQNNATIGATMVTTFIGIGVAVLIVLTAIVVVVITLILFYSRKSFNLNQSPTMMILIQSYTEERLNNYSHTHSNLLLTCMTRFN